MPAKPNFSAKLSALIVSALIPFAASAEDAPVLKLTVINSSETDVPTYILGHVLQKAGYEVEFVSADYTAGLTGLAQGDLDSFMCWDTTWDACQEAVATGDVINVGSSGVAGEWTEHGGRRR